MTLLDPYMLAGPEEPEDPDPPDPTYADVVLADSPLAYYPLGEASGTTLVDASGNGRNGTIDAGVALGAATAVPADPAGHAWSLDAAEGGEVAAASWMAPATALTAEAWVYLTAYDPQGTVVMCRSEVGASNSKAAKAWSLQITATGGLTGRVYNEAGTTVSPTSAAGVVPLNTLCHVAFVQNGTNALYYVNGVQVATAALTGVPVAFASNTKPLNIGKTTGTGFGTYSYTGRIQHAAFYGSALSPTRLTEHYQAGISAAAYGPEEFVYPDEVYPGTTNAAQTFTLGSRFQVIDAGLITGIRYRSLATPFANRYVGLWRDDGTLLYGARFTGEVASAWNVVPIPTPILVNAGETYRVAIGHPGTVGHTGNYAFGDPASYTLGGDHLTWLTGVYSTFVGSGGDDDFPANLFAQAYFADVVYQPAP
jgi:hypothetical protein